MLFLDVLIFALIAILAVTVILVARFALLKMLHVEPMTYEDEGHIIKIVVCMLVGVLIVVLIASRGRFL
jgi:hypothetical protein